MTFPKVDRRKGGVLIDESRICPARREITEAKDPTVCCDELTFYAEDGEHFGPLSSCKGVEP